MNKYDDYDLFYRERVGHMLFEDEDEMRLAELRRLSAQADARASKDRSAQLEKDLALARKRADDAGRERKKAEAALSTAQDLIAKLERHAVDYEKALDLVREQRDEARGQRDELERLIRRPWYTKLWSALRSRIPTIRIEWN